MSEISEAAREAARKALCDCLNEGMAADRLRHRPECLYRVASNRGALGPVARAINDATRREREKWSAAMRCTTWCCAGGGNIARQLADHMEAGR